MKEFITTGQIYLLFAIIYFIIAVYCMFSGNVLLCIFAVLMSINTVLMYRREKRKNKK